MSGKLAALFFASAICLSAQTIDADRDAESKSDDEFAVYLKRTTPGYREIMARQRERLQTLRQKVEDRELHSQDTSCSRQILQELDWLMDNTRDLARGANRMNDLESILAHPENEARGAQQDPGDGSWGRRQPEWFFKITAPTITFRSRQTGWRSLAINCAHWTGSTRRKNCELIFRRSWFPILNAPGATTEGNSTNRWRT